MDPFIMVLIMDVLLLIVIMAIIFAYHKQENNYRKQLLDKMDRLIELMENKMPTIYETDAPPPINREWSWESSIYR